MVNALIYFMFMLGMCINNYEKQETRSYKLIINLHLSYDVKWRGGATGRALDLRSTGRGFKSYSGQKMRNNLGQVVHTYVPLLTSSITWYRPRGGDALRLGM